MDKLIEYLPFLLPILIVQLILMVTALVHAFKHKNFRFGNLVLWVIIIVFLEIPGPILYFTIGKGED